jgi:hypothetical protein
MAFSDYLVFGPLRDAIRKGNFTTDQQVKAAARTWLVSEAKSLFAGDIQKPVLS